MKTQLKMKVDVYRNLHKNCWSVRSREQHDYGKVVAHANSLVLDDAKFVGSTKSTSTYFVSEKYNLSPGLKSAAKFEFKPVIFSLLLVAS